MSPFFFLTKKAFEQATAIFGITDGYLNWGLNYAGRKKNDWDGVFPLSYPDSKFDGNARKIETENLRKLGVNPEKKIVWFVGTFGKTYDLLTVIKAAKDLEKKRSDIQFVLSGNGENFQFLKENCQGLNSLVFTNWINSDQIQSMMRLATVAIAPYVKGAPQALPNKYMEYFSAGLPIVSNLPGETELFLKTNEAGLTYEAGNAQSLIDKLNDILSDEAPRIKMGENARQIFDKFFNPNMVFPGIISRLEKIAGKKESFQNLPK
ncbi:MAG: glycosyltransferase [Candidatus Riflebacteria bacterium]|nr:glycosyltransferase [Candidatus Riflebacteria bacterium]